MTSPALRTAVEKLVKKLEMILEDYEKIGYKWEPTVYKRELAEVRRLLKGGK